MSDRNENLPEKLRTIVERSPRLTQRQQWAYLEAADEIERLRKLARPEEGLNSIGELKDIYTIAQHVGIPGTKIDNFIKTAAMCGYILVRPTVDSPDAAGEEQ